MKFIADGMLGKLVRWLRLSGQDVIYINDLKTLPDKEDNALLNCAKFEKRTLLTCDLDLHRRAKRFGIDSIFIRNNDVIEQLIQISKYLGKEIRIDPKNSRCPLCNGLLKIVGKNEVKNSIPTSVLKTHHEFWKCLDCDKIYWKGKHWKTISEMVSKYSNISKKKNCFK